MWFLIALFIFVIIAFLLIIAILLDILTGIKVRHPKLPLYSPRAGMNRIRYFTNGRELFRDMLEEIGRARHHIHLSFFIFEADEVGQQWLSLLKKKASEGVQVRLLVDALNGRSLKRLKTELEAAGVQIAFSNKVTFPFTFYELNRRNHRKIAVIDGNIGYFGGFNISRDYLGMNAEKGPWHDNHLKVIGESVAELQRLFLDDWAKATGQRPEDGEFFPVSEKGPVMLTLQASSGRQIDDLFAEKLQRARSSIVIGSPYFIPSRTLMNVLLDRLARGVQLTILLPMKKDHPLVKPASILFLRPLVERGAKLFYFYQGFYHSKVFVVDGRLCYIGTTNFDRRSLFWNDELSAFIAHPATVADVIGRLRQEIENSSTRAAAETLRHRGPFQRLKSVCSGWFRSLL